MDNIETVYQELHHLVRHGQKQGFIAGVIFSGAVLAMIEVRDARRFKKQFSNDQNNPWNQV